MTDERLSSLERLADECLALARHVEREKPEELGPTEVTLVAYVRVALEDFEDTMRRRASHRLETNR